MMSLTGIKGILRLPKLVARGSKKKSRAGFTLIEVMVTASVLALGAALIYQSFFIALDSFNYYSTLLKITPWMDEKIWQAQNDLKHSGAGAVETGSGQFEVDNKSVNWSLACNSADQTESLYRLDLTLVWPQGSRQVKLSRAAYAIHLEK